MNVCIVSVKIRSVCKTALSVPIFVAWNNIEVLIYWGLYILEKEKLRKVIAILTIITTIITLINVGFNFLIPMYLSHKVYNELGKGSTIGIIGGADGPTAIYLTSQSSSYISTIIFVLLSISGVLYLCFSKKTTK